MNFSFATLSNVCDIWAIPFSHLVGFRVQSRAVHGGQIVLYNHEMGLVGTAGCV